MLCVVFHCCTEINMMSCCANAGSSPSLFTSGAENVTVFFLDSSIISDLLPDILELLGSESANALQSVIFPKSKVTHWRSSFIY